MTQWGLCCRSSGVEVVVPPQTCDIQVHLVGPHAQTNIKMTFVLAESCRNVHFRFPVPDRAAVVQMETTIAGHKTVAKVYDTETARRVFNEAVSRGRTAQKVEKTIGGRFELALGNIQAGQPVEVLLVHVATVPVTDDNQYTLVVPTHNMPLYSPPGAGPRSAAESGSGSGRKCVSCELLDANGEVDCSILYDSKTGKSLGCRCVKEEEKKAASSFGGFSDIKGPGRLTITVACIMPAPQSGGDITVMSPTHRLAIHELLGESTDKACSRKVFSVQDLSGNKSEVVVLVGQAARTQGEVLLTAASNDDKGIFAASLSFFPTVLACPLDNDDQEQNAIDFWIVADRSGSMFSNKGLENTDTTLIQAFDYLANEHGENKNRLNLIYFGNTFDVCASKKGSGNLQELRAFVEARKRVDMGGTEIMPPLRHIAGLPLDPEHPNRVVIVMTDGGVCNKKEVLHQVDNMFKANGTRVFTMGYGADVDRTLVDDMAIFGRGVASFSNESTDIGTTFVNLMATAQQPAIEITQVEWKTKTHEPPAAAAATAATAVDDEKKEDAAAAAAASSGVFAAAAELMAKVKTAVLAASPEQAVPQAVQQSPSFANDAGTGNKPTTFVVYPGKQCTVSALFPKNVEPLAVEYAFTNLLTRQHMGKREIAATAATSADSPYGLLLHQIAAQQIVRDLERSRYDPCAQQRIKKLGLDWNLVTSMTAFTAVQEDIAAVRQGQEECDRGSSAAGSCAGGSCAAGPVHFGQLQKGECLLSNDLDFEFSKRNRKLKGGMRHNTSSLSNAGVQRQSWNLSWSADDEEDEEDCGNPCSTLQSAACSRRPIRVSLQSGSRICAESMESQKRLAPCIGNELDDQNEVLSEFGSDMVDKSDDLEAGVQRFSKNAVKLSRKTSLLSSAASMLSGTMRSMGAAFRAPHTSFSTASWSAPASAAPASAAPASAAPASAAPASAAPASASLRKSENCAAPLAAAAAAAAAAAQMTEADIQQICKIVQQTEIDTARVVAAFNKHGMRIGLSERGSDKCILKSVWLAIVAIAFLQETAKCAPFATIWQPIVDEAVVAITAHLSQSGRSFDSVLLEAKQFVLAHM